MFPHRIWVPVLRLRANRDDAVGVSGQKKIHPTPPEPVIQSSTMTRDWILRVLEDLALWYWPIFLWECARVRLVLDGMFAETGGMISFGVTPTGRIVIVSHVPEDRPTADDWTRYAPREPWAALSLERQAARLAALADGLFQCTIATPLSHRHQTIPTPAFLDSG